MATAELKVERFGGLDLVSDVGELGWGAAIDLLNVDFDQRGRVRTRDGLTSVATGFAAPGNTKVFAWPVSSTSDVVLVSNSLNSAQTYKAGAIVDTDVGQGAHNVARLGSGGAVAAYYAAAGSTIRKVDSAGNITIPAGMPNARFVAVQAPDNRLVAGCVAGTLSRVQFSDAGAPETWGANNYVDLYPDDGEDVTGLVSWRDFTFAFKRSRFFVFYGNSEDSSGNPLFNFRAVDAGVGASLSTGPEVFGHNVVAGPDGVYFYAKLERRAGIYRTTGGVPERVSAPLDPLFQPQSDQRAPYFSYGAAAAPDVRNLCMIGDRLHVAVVSGTNYLSLLYDPFTRDWTVWALAGAVSAPMFAEGLSTTYAINGTTTLYALDAAATDDDGTAIASRYRSGFSDLGMDGPRPDGRKVTRQWHLRGSGAVTFGVAADDAAAIPTTAGGAEASVDLAAARPNYRTSQLGNDFSWQVRANSGAWRLDAVKADL